MSSRYVTDETLSDWFGYHPPASKHVRLGHELIRENFLDIAQFLNDLLPEGPDKTVALRAVREAMYHANACLAVAQKVMPGYFDDEEEE